MHLGRHAGDGGAAGGAAADRRWPWSAWLINVVQVLTSLQDNTISSVPRLLATAVGAILLMPWMLRKLALFTLQMFADFRPLLR